MARPPAPIAARPTASPANGRRATTEAAALKILVVAPSWIGDTVMAQPLLARLREKHPEASIDVLAPAWSAPLLARMAEVGRVIVNPFDHGQLQLGERRRLGRSLATAGYDEAIVLPNSLKSALIPFFADIPRRTGFRGEMRYGLINRMHRLDKKALPRLVDRYALLAEEPSAQLAALPPLPRLHSTPELQRATRAALELPADASPYIFCPGAEYGPAKRWPPRYFATLASAIHYTGEPVWLVGSAKDAPIGAEIERLSNGAAVNLCGRTTLEQAVDLIASARQVICNDSGLMHIAAALDRPLIAIYGSSSASYTPPLSPRAKVVSLALDCAPCFERECPQGHLRCLNELTPERVLAALRS